MKITKRQLRKIIREEKHRLLREMQDTSGNWVDEDDGSGAAYEEVDRGIQNLIVMIAEKYADGVIGNAAQNAKMNGDTMAYQILTQAAIASREK